MRVLSTLFLSLSLSISVSVQAKSLKKMKGTFEKVIVDEFESGKNHVEYIFEDAKTRKIKKLKFKDKNKKKLQSLKSGQYVEISSSSLTGGSSIELDSIATAEEPLDQVRKPWSPFNRSVLFVSVNFKDYQSGKSQEQIAQSLPYLKKIYETSTYNKFQYDLDKNGDGNFDIVTFNFDKNIVDDGCNEYTWQYEMAARWDLEGFDYQSYQQIVLYYPNIGICGGFLAGRAVLGSDLHLTRGRTLFASVYNEMDTITTTAHELGHSNGLSHADSDESDRTSSVWQYSNYGDYSSFMGNKGEANLNIVQMDQLRVFDEYPDAILKLDQSAKNQTVEISALDIHPNQTSTPTGVKLLRSVISTTNQFTGAAESHPVYYYLSYRRKGVYANDDIIPDSYTTGVTIHHVNAIGGLGGGGLGTGIITTLNNGETFENLEAGIKITQISKTADKVQVRIEQTGANQLNFLDCNPGDLSLEMVTRQSTIQAGFFQPITVRSRSNDSVYCRYNNYDIDLILPSGIESRHSFAKVGLFPFFDSWEDSKFFVKPMSPGTYTVQARITDNDGVLPHHAPVTVSKTITVVENKYPDCLISAPTITVDKTNLQMATGVSNPITVSIKNNDSSSCPNTRFGVRFNESYDYMHSSRISKTPSYITLDSQPGGTVSATSSISSNTEAVLTLIVKVEDLDDINQYHGIDQTYVPVRIGQEPINNICVPGTPSFSFQNLTMNTNEQQDLIMTIKNNDNLYCSPTTFDLEASAQTSLTISDTSQKITLNPGESVAKAFTITSSDHAATLLTYFTLSDNDTVLPQHTTVTKTKAITVVSSTPSCSPSLPSLSLSSSSLSMGLDTEKSINVTIKNNDDIYCNATTYDLKALMNENLGVDVASQKVQLSPGSSVIKALKITSNGVAGVYSNNIRLEDNDGAAPAHTAVSGTLSVSVVDNTPTCSPSLPSISLSASSLSLGLNASKSVSVTVKNNDNAYCPTTSFDLKAIVPAGLAVNVPSQKVILLPGVSVTKSLTLTSGMNAGNYSANFRVEDNDGTAPTHIAVASALSVSVVDDSTPSVPNAPIDLTARIRKGSQINLKWAAPSNANGITKYRVYRVDAGQLGTSTDVSASTFEYNTSMPTGITFISYVVRSVNSAGVESASSNMVTLSDSKGGVSPKGGSGTDGGGGPKGGGKGKNK